MTIWGGQGVFWLDRLSWLLRPLLFALFAWYIVTAIGLLRLRSWARPHAIALAAVGLLFFPAGTILSIPVLVYLLRRDVARIFELGEGPADLTAAEARSLAGILGRPSSPSR